MPKLDKILDTDTHSTHRFIADQKVLERVIKQLKAKKKKIVLTQGVYDLIHEGHALYLEKAREYGDVLVVGIDSDEFTRARKGPNRPIVPQSERVKMLVHLRHVDIVTIRELHHGIGDLIRLVKPDVLITSSSTADFTEQMKKDYDEYCGKIVTLPPQATTSTTARIRNLTIEGAEKLANEIRILTENFLENIRKI
jgi:rfaE bifunctional protein nucleotidyltransferase chain/domain